MMKADLILPSRKHLTKSAATIIPMNWLDKIFFFLYLEVEYPLPG